jgi:1-acyl-sn-glycerol-3-phosphate acyltransferase
VFPQTTRTVSFDPAQFNTIGVKLAARAGVPVVPLALKTDAWGNGKWIRDFGPVDRSQPVHFRFGEPVAPEGKGARAQEITIEFIRKALAEWKHEER